MVIQLLSDKIRLILTSGNKRTALAKKNIIASFGLKIIGILISLQVVPLTINYINATQYGIWLTLSSIIAWIGYFDLGFAHGFRNRFAEAKAMQNNEMAKKYVSTTYAVLSILFLLIFIVVSIINTFLDWTIILNVDQSLKNELQFVFQILACFICLNIVASIFTTMLAADQRPALASLIQTSGQLLAFITIYIFTKTTQGSLATLAFAFSGIPCILLIIVSIIVFRKKKYRIYSPSFKCIQFKLTKNILGVGGQFFIITVSMLFIFQFINIIISRIEGPEAVTQYNIAYKFFNVLNMVSVIILSPFWSAFTEAYTQKDFRWMDKALHKLEKLWLLCIPTAIIMVIFSSWIYKCWIGSSISIPLTLSITVAVYIVSQILGGVYMYLINGTGKVRIQLIVYLSFSLIALPTLNIACKYWGIEGLLIIPTIVFLFQAILGRIQIQKIINETATGIWNK